MIEVFGSSQTSLDVIVKHKIKVTFPCPARPGELFVLKKQITVINGEDVSRKKLDRTLEDDIFYQITSFYQGLWPVSTWNNVRFYIDPMSPASTANPDFAMKVAEVKKTARRVALAINMHLTKDNECGI